MENDTDEIIVKLITYQREKLLKIATRISPGVTLEDIRNPQDIPTLYADPDFNFEDGILAGLLSAQMALRQHFNNP